MLKINMINFEVPEDNAARNKVMEVLSALKAEAESKVPALRSVPTQATLPPAPTPAVSIGASGVGTEEARQDENDEREAADAAAVDEAQRARTVTARDEENRRRIERELGVAPEGTGLGLLDAARDGDMAALRRLVEEGVDVNKADINGRTPAIHAADGGHTDVVRALLAVPGFDVDKADTNGWTVTMWAAARGRTEILRALLAPPSSDVNKVATDGRTAIMLAVVKYHTEVVRMLKAAPGIDLKMRATAGICKGKTAFELAIVNKNQGAADLLRPATKAVRAPPVKAVVPAAAGARVARAQPVVIARTQPLRVARTQSAVLWKWGLLLAGVAVVWALWSSATARTPSPRTFPKRGLYDAAKAGDLQVVKALLAGPGIAVNKAYENGWTATMAAAHEGHTHIVKALLAAPRIAVNSLDYNGWSALIHAACRGRTEAVRALLAAPGIEINKITYEGMTAIMEAAREGSIVVVRTFLAVPGIAINTVDNTGGTAIMYAAWNGHIEVVMALLAAPGIDVNKVDFAGKTAFAWATHRGHGEIAEALGRAAQTLTTKTWSPGLYLGHPQGYSVRRLLPLERRGTL